MDPYFSWRKLRVSDLSACLALHPAKNGAEVVGYGAALKAWQQILEMKHATRGAVVEFHTNGETEIVGFGLSTFVRNDFVAAEIENPRPGINSRIIESVLNGNPAIAGYSEVRDANTRGDLQQINLDTSWKVGFLNPAQVNDVRVLLARAYLDLFAGYRISGVYLEVIDELDLEQTQGHRSFKIVDRSDLHTPGRALITANAETMREDPFSVGAALFQRRVPPQFAFTSGEQELLELALEGIDDRDAARELNVSLPAIKHRWASIFERVAAIRPDLCPVDVNGTRGIQKRQRILTHVRKNPEELRPFDFSQRRG